MQISINQINKRRIIGEISKDPKLGKNLLIRFKKGSVNLWVSSSIEYTNLLCVFNILKAINQLITTLAITTYE